MHFVVSWDIESKGDEWTKLNEEMKGGLGEYPWVKPLSTLYIVRVTGQYDWDSIHTSLVGVCKKNIGKINFIMSPLMEGGKYNGWLPGSLWDKIRQRTQ